MAASEEAIRDVLEHLLYDAWSQGLVAPQGRVDAPLAQGCSDRYCLLSRRGPWTLVYARDPAVPALFHRGGVLFSRLEGEWCVRMG